MSQARRFTYPEDASRFPRSTKEILAIAHDLGWGIHWAGPSHVMARISAPGDTVKSINVPSTNMNVNRVKSILSQIRRYSDVEKFDAYVDEQTRVKGSLHFAMSRGKQDMPAPPPRETAIARAFREGLESERASHGVKPLVSREEDESLLRKVGEEVAATVVTEVPWMVRKGGKQDKSGRMYESAFVLHRVWSDGTEDYRCRFCEWANENPRSVSMHSSRTHRDKAPAEKPQLLHVEHYEPTEIKRPFSAIRRLTMEITSALDGMDDWASMAPDELARTLAEHVYAARPDLEPAAPLTPEQIIGRITLMVDGGRLAEMHQKVEEMAVVMREQSDVTTAAQVEAERLRTEVERLREERRALASLLSDSEASS